MNYMPFWKQLIKLQLHAIEKYVNYTFLSITSKFVNGYTQLPLQITIIPSSEEWQSRHHIWHITDKSHT